MDHYLDIHLLPDPEFVPTLLMSALFARLHRGLVQLGPGPIGISFPDVETTHTGLGERLRLHGTEADLNHLMATPWLAGMGDQVRIKPLRAIPQNVSHRLVRRVQAKSNPERLRRRWMRRKGMTREEAMKALPDAIGERLRLPYVRLHSASTGHPFPLFIHHGPLQDQPIRGRFSAYGLSSQATVPWF